MAYCIFWTRYGSNAIILLNYMAAKQCMQITNKPRKKSPYFVSDAETDRRKREAATATEAATAPGAVRDGAGDGATGRDWEWERELDFSWERRLRVRGRDWSLLSFFFLVCCDGFNFCVPEAAGDGVGDGATGRDWDWERARERGDWEGEGETESLNLVFFFLNFGV